VWMWEGYITSLRTSHDRIKEEDNEMVWLRNKTRGTYSPNPWLQGFM
jgi:hypothetical protein